MNILPPRNMVIALIVATALFMQNLDSTIIATALPAMAEAFGESAVRLSLAITAYLLAVAVFIPVSGWVADRFGAREVFCAAILVFTLGSVLCGLSNSLIELTGARIVQGIGGAMMVPVGRLVLMRNIGKSELVRAMSYLTTPAILGPVIGPPLGGFITTYWSWRWIFFLNVPVCLLGIALVLKMIKNPPRESEPPPLDAGGFFLTAAALSALTFGIDLLAHPAAGGLAIAALLVAGLGFGAAAVLHAKRVQHPIIDLSLLELRTFAATIDAGTLYRISAGALPFLLPVMLQVGFGMSAFESGTITFATAIGAFANKLTIHRVLRRFGYRATSVGTGVASALSLAACALFTAAWPVSAMLAILLLGGFFRSLQYTSLNSLAFCDVPPQKLSAATTFVSMTQQITNGVGVALGAILLNAARLWRGDAELATSDFHAAFVVVAALCLASALWFLRLQPEAGAEVSGHKREKEAPAE